MKKMIAAKTRIWPANGHYMGSIWAYFCKRVVLMGWIFEGGNRVVLRAFFCEL